MILGTSAELVSDKKSCNITSKTTDTPHYVLGRLKGNGYRVVRVSSVGETCVSMCDILRLTEWEEIVTKDEAVSFEEPGQGSLGYFLSCYNYV